MKKRQIWLTEDECDLVYRSLSYVLNDLDENGKVSIRANKFASKVHVRPTESGHAVLRSTGGSAGGISCADDGNPYCPDMTQYQPTWDACHKIAEKWQKSEEKAAEDRQRLQDEADKALVERMAK